MIKRACKASTYLLLRALLLETSVAEIARVRGTLLLLPLKALLELVEEEVGRSEH